MIRIVSVCPYCEAASAGVDTTNTALVLAPNRPKGRPCPHVAVVYADLAAFDPQPERVMSASGTWVWTRRAEIEAIAYAESHPLVEWLQSVVSRSASLAYLPTVECRLTGGSSVDREVWEEGTGRFRLRVADGRLVTGFLEGWGLYSPTPVALAAEARRLAAHRTAGIEEGIRIRTLELANGRSKTAGR